MPFNLRFKKLFLIRLYCHHHNILTLINTHITLSVLPYMYALADPGGRVNEGPP